jgi:hypothetical protein
MMIATMATSRRPRVASPMMITLIRRAGGIVSSS